MEPENSHKNDNFEGKLLRLLRPSVIILCGPAACGKSTFAEKHFRPTQIISSDWARARVCDDERDQRFNTQAFALVHFLIEQRLTLNRLCVVDSTALTAQARKDLLDLAKQYSVPTTVMCFNVPLATCLERDEKRKRSVGRAVIERQYQAFEQTMGTLHQEGFDQVVELGGVDLENVRIEILFRPTVRPPAHPATPEWSGARRFARQRPTANGSAPTRPAVGTLPAGTVVPTPAPPAANPAVIEELTTPTSEKEPRAVSAPPAPPRVPVRQSSSRPAPAHLVLPGSA